MDVKGETMYTTWEKIEDFFYPVYHQYYKMKSYIRGWWKQSNKLHTNLPYNTWYDKDTLITESLFYAIDDYVSKKGEDAFSVVDWNAFPDNRVAKGKIIQILHWYHIERPELEKTMDNLLKELYGKPDQRIQFIDNEVVFPDRSPEETLKAEKLNEIEGMVYRKNKYYAKMVCSILGYLWC